jgi:prepilin-type N-terminal cleavage/methylation domain-containing protein
MQRPTFLHSNSGGFTLVEAMVVVAIVAALIGFSYTGFSGVLQRQRCQAAAEKIAWVLKQAQIQAVEKHTPCAVTLGTGNGTIQTFLDHDHNLILDVDDNDTQLEKLNIVQEYRGVGITSSTRGAHFYFSSRGIPRGTLPDIRLSCQNTPGSNGDVTVSMMGRVTIATPNNWQY